MRYEVPQYIEEEAKIAGPFNLKQFVILFFGFLICASFFVFFKAGTAVFLTVIFMTTLVFLLLGKYNGRPIIDTLTSALRHVWLPKIYVWRKPSVGSQEVFVEQAKTVIMEEPEEEKPKPKVFSATELKQLSQELDKSSGEQE